MGLKLNVASSRAYVQAVSGLFISKENPNGLTSKEMDVLSCLMEFSFHGMVTKEARNKAMEKLGFKKQNFYNAMSSLREKKAVSGEKLHTVFVSTSLYINYADNS